MFAKPLMMLGALALFALPSRMAVAHPHVWIDSAAVLQFDKGQITAIRFAWVFDEFFSTGVIGEFDKNKNKIFDADEIEPMREEAFEGTREAGFFTDIQTGAGKFDIQTITDFSARIEKDILIYEFTVPFATPIDPAKFSLSVYDTSYFIDIAFLGHEPIRLIGDGSANCTVLLAEDHTNPIYGGVVYPKKAQLQCTQ